MAWATFSKDRKLEEARMQEESIYLVFSAIEMCQCQRRSSQLFHVHVCHAPCVHCPTSRHQIPPPLVGVPVQGVPLPGHVKEVGSDLSLCTEQHRARLVHWVVQRQTQLAIPPAYIQCHKEGVQTGLWGHHQSTCNPHCMLHCEASMIRNPHINYRERLTSQHNTFRHVVACQELLKLCTCIGVIALLWHSRHVHWLSSSLNCSVTILRNWQYQELTAITSNLLLKHLSRSAASCRVSWLDAGALP